MSGKSAKREMLERSLAENPTDSFLRYGLAVQCLRDGDLEEGRSRLRSLISDHPDDQVAAFQQLGQSYAETDEPDAAIEVLEQGISLAERRGDHHAAAEMAGLLDSIRP